MSRTLNDPADALAEAVAAVKRRELMEMLDGGAFDDLADSEVMAGAWVAMRRALAMRCVAAVVVATVAL